MIHISEKEKWEYYEERRRLAEIDAVAREIGIYEDAFYDAFIKSFAEAYARELAEKGTEAYEAAYAEGLVRAEPEAQAALKVERVKYLLRNNYLIDDIITITRFSEEQILSIKKQLIEDGELPAEEEQEAAGEADTHSKEYNQGWAEAQEEMARRMLGRHMSFYDIASITGLDEAALRAIRHELES